MHRLENRSSSLDGHVLVPAAQLGGQVADVIREHRLAAGDHDVPAAMLIDAL
jgi:hypothetical protein